MEIGAKNINKEYQDGILKGIKFLIDIKSRTMAFELPAKIDRVFDILWDQVKQPQAGTRQRVKEQAERTAWKIISDWVDIQASMILLEQAQPLQVFLPYVLVSTGETLFTHLQNNSFKLLNAAPGKLDL